LNDRPWKLSFSKKVSCALACPAAASAVATMVLFSNVFIEFSLSKVPTPEMVPVHFVNAVPQV
jgi:hypothetical protein